MIRTKMKISYHAGLNKISVLEHFLNAMIKTYKALFEEVEREILSHSPMTKSHIEEDDDSTDGVLTIKRLKTILFEK